MVYLEEICTQANFKNPRLAAKQLLLIGEGLIVSSQVNGVCADLIEAGREMVGLLGGDSKQ